MIKAERKAGGPVLGDGFGEALKECWAAGGKAGHSYATVERDDGFLFTTDVAEYFDELDEHERHEQWVIKRAGGRVLDVGCGAGRHAIALAQRGADVVGVDTSPGAVYVSRQRGVRVLRGTVEEQGDDIGRFDCILLLGYNLGLLESCQKAPQLLSGLARKANVGTRLFGNSLNPAMTSHPDHLRYREENRRQGRLPGTSRMRIRHKNLATDWFDYLYLTPEELGELVVGTGWEITEIETEGQSYAVELTLTQAGRRSPTSV
ncbi:class I SAM-dependent methyltransferase [Micromonospora halophytica]|uniref:class I SAM-dependent methyltransferase n=1 Tax=Micromonospora halophytica TaxID=47864 RepID=UPI00147B45E3|nr:class I SAM-dependent methyltransferase [Micromonospora halophytica]